MLGIHPTYSLVLEITTYKTLTILKAHFLIKNQTTYLKIIILANIIIFFSKKVRVVHDKRLKAIASGWESDGPGFKPLQLQATFDPGLPKKVTKCALQIFFH